MSTIAAHTSRSRVVRIKGVDDERQIVTGEVYAPMQLDTYGEFMFEADIEQMAHSYMRLKLDQTIDTGHDNKATKSYPVESWIQREPSETFTQGAWCVAVKCDDASWAKVKSGEINAFSFEAMVSPVECEVAFWVLRDHVGLTAKAADDDHDHAYFVQVGDDGNVIGGYTSPGPNGHTHPIQRASITGPGSDGSVAHRYHL